MTEHKKNKFLGMAKATLGVNKPTGLADFLDDTEDNEIVRKVVTTENRIEALPNEVENNEIIRKTVATENRIEILPNEVENNEIIRKVVTTENRIEVLLKETEEPRTAREEFKLTKTLAKRLKRYAYEKEIKKVDVVTMALEKFFNDEGY